MAHGCPTCSRRGSQRVEDMENRIQNPDDRIHRNEGTRSKVVDGTKGWMKRKENRNLHAYWIWDGSWPMGAVIVE